MPAAIARAPKSQHCDVNDVRREIQQHDTGHAEYQTTRQVYAWLLDLTRHKRRGLPTAVGEDHRHERRAESG
jgi:hypothetical protein